MDYKYKLDKIRAKIRKFDRGGINNPIHNERRGELGKDSNYFRNKPNGLDNSSSGVSMDYNEANKFLRDLKKYKAANPSKYGKVADPLSSVQAYMMQASNDYEDEYMGVAEQGDESSMVDFLLTRYMGEYWKDIYNDLYNKTNGPDVSNPNTKNKPLDDDIDKGDPEVQSLQTKLYDQLKEYITMSKDTDKEIYGIATNGLKHLMDSSIRPDGYFDGVYGDGTRAAEEAVQNIEELGSRNQKVEATEDATVMADTFETYDPDRSMTDEAISRRIQDRIEDSGVDMRLINSYGSGYKGDSSDVVFSKGHQRKANRADKKESKQKRKQAIKAAKKGSYRNGGVLYHSGDNVPLSKIDVMDRFDKGLPLYRIETRQFKEGGVIGNNFELSDSRVNVVNGIMFDEDGYPIRDREGHIIYVR